MAHVRHINVVGCPDYGDQQEGYFSIVVSSMTGDVTTSQPTTHIVHLVSLEHYDSTILDPTSSFHTNTKAKRVGMISLFSWTYTCIPETVNFSHAMKALAENMQPLKPEQRVLDDMKASAAKQNATMNQATSILHDRLDRGYTIHRWRTATGEETVAFNRGPLVPSPTPAVPAKDPGDTAVITALPPETVND
jgi:hypothetical protein